MSLGLLPIVGAMPKVYTRVSTTISFLLLSYVGYLVKHDLIEGLQMFNIY